ncbi:MAG TPA: hypothetical protein VHE10_02530 [Candidatus Paceibacterota bacterium]|nr:hypothetical protein [Candidatus Paceibacterota bacterium]
MNKTDKNKEILLEQFRKTPVIQIACEKTGVSRMTYYRWLKEDKEFEKLALEALAEGKLMVNDLAESQLISAIKDKNMTAIMQWLRHHHPEYKNKLEVTAVTRQEELTPEQEALVREALRLASGEVETETAVAVDINDNGKPNDTTEKSDAAPIGGGDAQGQKSEDGNH